MLHRIEPDRAEAGDALRAWAIVILAVSAMTLWAGAASLLLG